VVPSKKRVKAQLQEMIDRLDRAGDEVHENLARALPRRRRIQIDVSDLEASYWTDLAKGRMGKLNEGEAPDGADITLRASSDDLSDMIDGEKSLVSMYFRGKIRINASLSDIMALRKMA
jgi:hypothetical protein